MLLSYITTESNGTLTLDQLLRGPLSDIMHGTTAGLHGGSGLR